MNYDKIYPTLDLHGEYQGSAKILTEEFINDNIALKKRTICIIHGRSGGILKKCVYEILKNDKRVKSYKTDYFNTGCTIVELKDEEDYE